MRLTVLIPAYNPGAQLVELVRSLVASDFAAIVVVNDGSVSTCDPVFQTINALDKVTLLRHAVNLGKGAALKTGLNHIYCHSEDHVGTVVVDADGQHLVEDALKVGNRLLTSPHSLIIGVRSFDRDVPLRSRVGNRLTGLLFRMLTGTALRDTQSGLRGIPRQLIPVLLRIPASGYEFELDMLLSCKYAGVTILQQPIETVYLDGNSSSHFNPIIDSMKIYFVLFRFSFTSLLSALIDNAVFILVYGASASIPLSQVAARLLATAFNYSAVRNMVFSSRQRVARTLPKYLVLVCISGFVSYLLIKVLTLHFSLSVIVAKVCAETIIFLANFTIQRDLIFVDGKKGAIVEPSRL